MTLLELAVGILTLLSGILGWYTNYRIKKDAKEMQRLRDSVKGWQEAYEAISKAKDARLNAHTDGPDGVPNKKYRRSDP